MTLSYISTRGKAPKLGFTGTTLAGLARDGGLYVPETLPALPDISGLLYAQAAFSVMAPFVGDDIPPADLKNIIDASYKVFSHPDIAPLHQLDDNFYLLELFHGPTLAFKDVALQFLGNLFDFILSRKDARVTIIGATSGDTGSAAIEAFKGKKNADIFILHPRGRVSEVQRRQMTTVDATNVFNIAVEGSFDDCQNIVKALFNDETFRDDMALSAVNSINWARILAQVVYYAHAAARLAKPVTFCVPTGNFGNIYAGHVARGLKKQVGGAQIEKLIVATNRNDILHRFFAGGEMKTHAVAPSLSPSMDIQISSNFERLLFELQNRDGATTGATMKTFRETGAFKAPAGIMAQLKKGFASGRLDDAETLATIKATHDKYGYTADPHTAVGLGVAENWRAKNPETALVALATAHPAKFPDAVKQATGFAPALPPFLADLYDRPEKCDALPADPAAVQKYMRERAHKR